MIQKIEKIIIKKGSKDLRIQNIVSLAKKNSTKIITDKTERFEAYFYPKEMKDINFLETIIFKKRSSLSCLRSYTGSAESRFYIKKLSRSKRGCNYYSQR